MSADQYCKYSEEIFEKTLAPGIVQDIFDGKFSFDKALEINPAVDLDNLKVEIAEIGVES
jgi:hypothetical protein